MAKLFTDAFYTAIDGDGEVISGAKWNFYEEGTTTRQDTYTDDDLTVAHANPVVADSAGRFAPIYLQNLEYKAVLTDAADVTIKTIDPVHGAPVAEFRINVKSRGAKGDGTTDDTTAIQAAIDDAISLGIGVVYFPSGKYRCTAQLTVDTGGLTLLGDSGALLQTSAVVSRLNFEHSGTGILVNSAAGMANAEFADGATNLLRGFVMRNLSLAAGDPEAVSGAPQAARGIEVRNGFEQIIVENCSFRGFTFCSAFFNNVWNLRLESCTVRGAWPPDSSLNGVYGFLGYNANSVYCTNTYVIDTARPCVGFRWMGAEAGTMVACQTDRVGAGIWIDDNAGKFAIDQHWAEQCRQRYPGQVVAYNVTGGGSGYTSAPTVTIGAAGANGVLATAVALISGGAVTKVLAFNPGSDYATAPSVSFSGGGGSGATATSVITDTEAGTNEVAPLIIGTNCEGIRVKSGHLIWGGDTGLAETINGHTAHVWTYNCKDVELVNNKLIGGGMVANGIYVIVARSGSDRIRVYDSNRTETTGFIAAGRSSAAGGTIQVSYDDEFGAIEFPGDHVEWLPAKVFDICQGTPTFVTTGTPPGQINVWQLQDAAATGVQAIISLPTSQLSFINRTMQPFIYYITDTAAGAQVYIAARPSLFQEGVDPRAATTVYRQRPESTTANFLTVQSLASSANWAVVLSDGDVAANIAILRDGAHASDTSTGNLQLIGVMVRIEKEDWTV